MNRIRVALVEDDEVIRTFRYRYLVGQPELDCVLVASSAEDLLAQLDNALAPQVILLDINLPGMSGLEVIPHILRRLPDAYILMQTVMDDSDTIYQALQLGAMGYILKNTNVPLLDSVLEVVKGGLPFSRSVARKVLMHFKPTPRLQPALLSPREREVLEGLVDGLTTKRIAVRLSIGTASVNTLIKRIYAKLQVRSRPELLSRALRGDL